MNLAAPPHRTHTDNSDDEPYRVISVESAETPEGCAGRDWFVYRIMQGTNGITGYRRGNRESVRGDAETIVVALNERREWKKNKMTPKDRRKTAAAARAAAVVVPAVESATAVAAAEPAT
ncbi:MAG TPA: hypothetical protein VN818_02025 [Gammaproteobacteria bacterium]|nr:hypothetical protein [Gammaproteobacteria bacterium]